MAVKLIHKHVPENSGDNSQYLKGTGTDQSAWRPDQSKWKPAKCCTMYASLVLSIQSELQQKTEQYDSMYIKNKNMQN